MERIDLWFKGSLAFFGALFTLLSDNFGVLFAVLVVIQIVDVPMGILASIKMGERIRSAIGIDGFNRKIGVLVLIGLVYLIEINLFGTNTLGGSLTAIYIGFEFLSITENLTRMGVYIHPKVTKFIEVIKGRDEK